MRNLTLIVQIYNNITNASLTQGHSSVFNCIIYVLDCSVAIWAQAILGQGKQSRRTSRATIVACGLLVLFHTQLAIALGEPQFRGESELGNRLDHEDRKGQLRYQDGGVGRGRSPSYGHQS